MKKRSTMKFLVPANFAGIRTTTAENRSIIPCYISPTSFNISESKIIQSDLTKGGYVIQYWGENLTKISASGSTGSGGIEAVHILRDIYRSEQIQFKKFLMEKAKNFNQQANEAIGNESFSTVVQGAVSILDSLFNNGVTGIIDGSSSLIDELSSIIEDRVATPQRTELIPSIAAFALAIDLYFQGEKFRGYFETFEYQESAQSPGLFNYNFNFTVLKRYGKRGNFMPWHRNPLDSSGQAVEASVPLDGPSVEELTFPVDTSSKLLGSRARSSFSNFQDGTPPINNVGVNRFGKLK